MVLWWIGNVVLLVVVLPVVLILLRRVILAAKEIEGTVDALAEGGPVLVSHLSGVPELLHTQELVHETSAGLARYGAALDKIL